MRLPRLACGALILAAGLAVTFGGWRVHRSPAHALVGLASSWLGAGLMLAALLDSDS